MLWTWVPWKAYVAPQFYIMILFDLFHDRTKGKQKYLNKEFVALANETVNIDSFIHAFVSVYIKFL